MTLLGSAFAGLATGARSAAALAAIARSARPGWIGTGASVAQAGEIIVDKLPMTPSRLEIPGLAARLAAGAVAGAILARGGGDPAPVGALVGAAGSLGASVAGVRARAVLASRLGSELPGALAEDVLAVVAAELAARRG